MIWRKYRQLFIMFLMAGSLLISPGCQGPSDEPEPAASLQWNTFMGGISLDRANRIAADGSGNIYIVGTSESSWGSPLHPFGGDRSDAFVAKFDDGGALQWNTFLGLTYDGGKGIALDGSGNVYMIGRNHVAKLDANGTWQWRTPIKGGEPESIAVDSHANIYITASYNHFDSSDVWNDTLVWTFNADGVGKIITSWSNNDWMDVYGLTVDGSGNIYLAGEYNGNGFATKLDPAGNELWSISLGENSQYQASRGNSIVVDKNGNIYVAGISASSWFKPNENDIFVARLNANGVLQWNTFLGGGLEDEGTGIALDASGSLYIVGSSDSAWGSPLSALNGGKDTFVAQLDDNGILQWNTFLGGGTHDYGKGIALNNEGNIYITGDSYSSWGRPLDPHNVGLDAFVAKLSGNKQD